MSQEDGFSSLSRKHRLPWSLRKQDGQTLCPSDGGVFRDWDRGQGMSKSGQLASGRLSALGRQFSFFGPQFPHLKNGLTSNLQSCCKLESAHRTSAHRQSSVHYYYDHHLPTKQGLTRACDGPGGVTSISVRRQSPQLVPGSLTAFCIYFTHFPTLLGSPSQHHQLLFFSISFFFFSLSLFSFLPYLTPPLALVPNPPSLHHFPVFIRSIPKSARILEATPK